MVVLRAFLVVADLDPYRTDWARLGQETRDEVVDKLPAAMQRATDGLLRAITLLRAEGIHNERMLPYGLQLLGLAVWLAEDPTPRPETILLLRRWLWLTGFSAWFGQGNPSRYARLFVEMVREARKTAAGAPPPGELQNLPWSTSPLPMPTRFDMRSARVRTLLSILARPGCRQPDGVLLSAEELAVRLLQRGPDATRRIAARSAGYASSPANRMFDVFDGAREQARTLLRRNDVNQEFCESHLLPWPLRDALSSPEGVEELLAERQRRISIRELDLLRELKLELYTEGATGPSPIDREDEAPVEPPN